jgi:hypothetical protein
MPTYNQSAIITYTADNTADFNLLTAKVNGALDDGRIEEILNSDSQAKTIQIRIVDQVEIT